MLSMYVKHQAKWAAKCLLWLFCKIPISIPLKSETVFTGILRSGIRYGAGTGYRCTALKMTLVNEIIEHEWGEAALDVFCFELWVFSFLVGDWYKEFLEEDGMDFKNPKHKVK